MLFRFEITLTEQETEKLFNILKDKARQELIGAQRNVDAQPELALEHSDGAKQTLDIVRKLLESQEYAQ